jgi:pimeloyl-ACP methyl ester carboxylesterase
MDGRIVRTIPWLMLVCLLLLANGCRTPISADKSAPRHVFLQVRGNIVSEGKLSTDTLAVLHRFDQTQQFEKSPDDTLQLLHQKAVETGERDLLYALAELNFTEGERLRHDASFRPWETRDDRDYYLASAVYAWFFIFQCPTNSLGFAFDNRFRAACDLYNGSLGWALTGRRATNAVALLQGGRRKLPVGQIEMTFSQPGFPWSLDLVSNFMIADQLFVRGLTVRNRQPGMGAPLIAVGQNTEKSKLVRYVPATVFLRVEGGLAELASNRCRVSLELYTPFVTNQVTVADRHIPLETDMTVPLAYSLNRSFVWHLGMGQFLSGEEVIPTGVYLTRSYQPGRIPVVFVHGTFSSPIWWAEMINTLNADPVLRERYQFWYFIYNSGNPVVYSANKLRDTLTAKLKELDPEGKDSALQQMVVIGHSQGGLLTKLTATDTGDKLWRVASTNRLEDLNISEAQKTLLRSYLYYKPLPFVKEVVFIATPHRGSYQIGGFLRTLADWFVALPGKVVDRSKELAGLSKSLNLPVELKDAPTSLDSMSPKNPFMLALAEIPVAPGVKSHSIVAVEGHGDYHEGADGVVKYTSAHQDYTDSEFIVDSFHSCLSQPATIEEVRRILREHAESWSGSDLNVPANP